MSIAGLDVADSCPDGPKLTKTVVTGRKGPIIAEPAKPDLTVSLAEPVDTDLKGSVIAKPAVVVPTMAENAVPCWV